MKKIPYLTALEDAELSAQPTLATFFDLRIVAAPESWSDFYLWAISPASVFTLRRKRVARDYGGEEYLTSVPSNKCVTVNTDEIDDVLAEPAHFFAHWELKRPGRSGRSGGMRELLPVKERR